MSHHNDTVSRAVEQPGSEFTAPETIYSLTSQELAGKAITALTAIARRDGEDFAEFACQILTAVAANVGGIDQLLATRSGSWEAAHVHAIVTATAGDLPEDLARHRTDPIRLWVDAEYELEDAGVLAPFDSELEKLEHIEDDAYCRMFDASCTPEEAAVAQEARAAIAAMAADQSTEGRARLLELYQQVGALHSAVQARAEARSAPEAVAHAAAVEAHRNAEERRSIEIESFRASFLEAARADVARRGLTIEVVVDESYVYGSEDLAAEVSDVAQQEALRQHKAKAVTR